MRLVAGPAEAVVDALGPNTALEVVLLIAPAMLARPSGPSRLPAVCWRRAWRPSAVWGSPFGPASPQTRSLPTWGSRSGWRPTHTCTHGSVARPAGGGRRAPRRALRGGGRAEHRSSGGRSHLHVRTAVRCACGGRGRPPGLWQESTHCSVNNFAIENTLDPIQWHVFVIGQEGATRSRTHPPPLGFSCALHLEPVAGLVLSFAPTLATPSVFVVPPTPSSS